MNAEIRDAERQVIEAAEAFLATWQKVGTLSNAYDAADDVIRAVRALRRTRKRIAREAKRRNPAP
jgi:hypothetical protein